MKVTGYTVKKQEKGAPLHLHTFRVTKTIVNRHIEFESDSAHRAKTKLWGKTVYSLLY
jgi:hypothetical protein